MLQTGVIKDSAELMGKAIQEDVKTSILINNRAAGHALLIGPPDSRAIFAGRLIRRHGVIAGLISFS